MILTYKLKHGMDFTSALKKAKVVAEFAVKHGFRTSTSEVKHFGLKSEISNQIIRKYGRDKKTRKIKNVNLIIPGQRIKVNHEMRNIYIPCLKLSVKYEFPDKFEKINQIEVSKEYFFISVTVLEKEQIHPLSWIGIDLNTTGHCCVVSNPTTGKVLKLGKKANYIHNKYKNLRKTFLKKKRFKLVKTIKNRESRIIQDLNHKISRKVVDYALKNNAGIVLEDLKGIRKTKKLNKNFRYSLNSWSFYQLGQFIEYKAKLHGIPVIKIAPAYTSQQCSRCGLLGNRNKKYFKCPACGHVDNADVNASFTIALRHQGILQMPIERDIGMGNTDIPEKATEQRILTSKLCA